ncbi:MAG: hypothetical protein NC131_10680 [Roseburia sp.]|nr:hypothetical protein [Roseburia sp.]
MSNINMGNNSGHIGDIYTINTRNELAELSQLLLQIQSAMEQVDITPEEREEANEYLAAIREEAEQDKPRGHFIKAACNGLKRLVSNQNFWNLVDKLSSHFLATIQK